MSQLGRLRSAEWPKGWDLNPRNACAFTGFRDRLLKPLGHPSELANFFTPTIDTGEMSIPIKSFHGFIKRDVVAHIKKFKAGVRFEPQAPAGSALGVNSELF